MSKSKLVSSPPTNHFKLSLKQYPIGEKDKEEIKNIPYACLVDNLMYTMIYTKLDITLAVDIVSRFFSNPNKKHQTTIKQFLKYLRNILRVCLYFIKGKAMLDGYIDIDMAGDIDSRKSTS